MSLVGLLYNWQLMRYAGEDGIAAYQASAADTVACYFADDGFVMLPVDYPVLPNYHLFLHKKDKTHPAYRVLTDIISKKYRKQV